MVLLSGDPVRSLHVFALGTGPRFEGRAFQSILSFIFTRILTFLEICMSMFLIYLIELVPVRTRTCTRQEYLNVEAWPSQWGAKLLYTCLSDISEREQYLNVSKGYDAPC
uniref:Uncharacterized protein n=1 Tax=Arabis alpina TaxID=50452 RepID=C3UJS3_ARAAL|nr:hypothetical protein [Arabis alpina]